jgi:hypothetical protein
VTARRFSVADAILKGLTIKSKAKALPQWWSPHIHRLTELDMSAKTQDRQEN